MSRDENNSAICPASLFSCLAMVYAGTGGNNAKEIAKLLHTTSDVTEVLRDTRELLNRIRQFDRIYHKSIKVPSRIFYNRSHNIKTEYIDLITNYFGRNYSPESINCEGRSAISINEWIRKETFYRIRQIILAYQLNQSLKLILFSAFYFKTDWKFPFRKKRTRKNFFYINPDNRIYVPTMAKIGQFRYRDDPDLACKIVELPFSYGLCMYILLPNQIDGLNSLCERINSATIDMMTSSLQLQDIQIFLPRFSINCQYDLSNSLKTLGMVKAFRERHDNVAFSKMTEDLKLFISIVNHQVNVDVYEGRERPPKRPENTLNQPYWYYNLLSNEIYSMNVNYDNTGYVK